MTMSLSHQGLFWLHGKPTATGVIKAQPEDFQVLEELGFTPDGAGEHVLARVRKSGLNTVFVAEALAKFVGIPARSVSYAGLKDRHAVTEQWFCLHLPGKETPDFSAFTLEGCQVVQTTRHGRKLRIGTLKGNAFNLILRDVSHRAAVEQRLQDIADGGVPNYFGSQRFGFNGNNIERALSWARGEIKVKERAKRSFYLSAARSALFNLIVSQRLARFGPVEVLAGDALQLSGRGSWFVAAEADFADARDRVARGELNLTAPLPGDGPLGSQEDALGFEQQCLAEQTDLLGLLTRERLEPARRALLLRPADLRWRWQDDATLSLSFTLPAGSFATSVVRELLDAPADIAL